MIDRDQLVEKAARAYWHAWYPDEEPDADDFASLKRDVTPVVDGLLPEVTTEEELRSLPVGQWLIGHRDTLGPVLVRRSDDFDGTGVMVAARPYAAHDALHFFGPLVVWHDRP